MNKGYCQKHVLYLKIILKVVVIFLPPLHNAIKKIMYKELTCTKLNTDKLKEICSVCLYGDRWYPGLI